MGLTAWHITFGTYGARLHGDPRLTVDRVRNEFNGPYVEPSAPRQSLAKAALTHPPVRLSRTQRVFLEQTIPAMCIRGGWRYDTCACAREHAHTLLRADAVIHGKHIRHWLKRWLTEALDREFGRRPGDGAWWAEGGSNRVVHDDDYLRTVTEYIDAQRTVRRGADAAAVAEAEEEEGQEEDIGPTRPGSLVRRGTDIGPTRPGSLGRDCS